MKEEIFNRLLDVSPELRECENKHDCAKCKEQSGTFCSIVDRMLESENYIGSLFAIRDAEIDKDDGYCICFNGCSRTYDLNNEQEAEEFYSKHEIFAEKEGYELYFHKEV